MSLVNTSKAAWFAAIALVANFGGQALLAQRPSSPADPAARKPIDLSKPFCIQGQPISKCRSFAIIELPIGGRVIHTLRSERHDLGDAYVGFELGGMVNRSETRAIGATISAAAAAEESHFSVSARSRTWLSDRSYRDVSLGLLATGTSTRGTAYGLTGTVGTGYSDLIGVFVGGDFGFLGGTPRASLHAGARLGSYATLGLAALAAALLVAGQPFHDDT
jgi:hypothetical protein